MTQQQVFTSRATASTTTTAMTANRNHDQNDNNTNTNRAVGAAWQYHNIDQVPPSGFEGPEKKLEIDFKNNNPSSNPLGLRAIQGEEWQSAVLDKTRCMILSKTVNEHFDSYVLSESCLLVYPTKIMIKTCGMIMLLNAIKPILQIAHRLDMTVEFVFYSRKNFLFPSLQPAPHRSFDEELSKLNQYFDGAGHVIGSLTQDHWYLYLADYSDHPVPALQNDTSADSVNCNGGSLARPVKKPDQTLEIMMHDLNPKKMQQFFKTESFISVEHTTESSGIADILPGSKIDAFQFEPCGYSMNGLLGEAYWTIHITPEDEFSFVSFETNISRDALPSGNYSQLVEKVIDVFEPGRFTVTLFADDHALPHKTYCELSFQSDFYQLNQHYSMDFCNGYNLVVCHWLHKHHPQAKKALRRVFSMEDALNLDDETECLSDSSVELRTNE